VRSHAYVCFYIYIYIYIHTYIIYIFSLCVRVCVYTRSHAGECVHVRHMRARIIFLSFFFLLSSCSLVTSIFSFSLLPPPLSRTFFPSCSFRLSFFDDYIEENWFQENRATAPYQTAMKDESSDTFVHELISYPRTHTYTRARIMYKSFEKTKRHKVKYKL